MKKQVLSIVLASCLSLASVVRADPDPQLKFDSESLDQKSSEKAEEGSKYGDKPLLKFGNEKNSIKIGGYGSFRFTADSAQNIHNTFTFRRFVFTTDALISSKLRIYSELEFERFRKLELERETAPNLEGGLSLSQAVEGTNQSEIAFEQVWFELAFTDYIRLRGGGILVPVGRFNIDHDDNRWNLPRRSLVDRGVPVLLSTSAWDELGIGLNGDIALGEKQKLSYQVYVMNGATIDFELEEVIATRDPERPELEFEGEFGISTGTFSQDIKDAKAVTGRIAYSPALGHEIGLSGYWGRYTPDYLIGKNAVSFGFDWLSQFGNFDFEGEYIYTHLDDLTAVLRDFGRKVGRTEIEVDDETSPDLETKVAFAPSQLASTKQGYWMEFRYHFRPSWLTNSWFGKHFSDPQLIPVLRWEQAFLSGLITDFEVLDRKVVELGRENRRVDRLTAGLAFRLNPLAVFHLAYEFTQTNSGKSLASVTNFLPTEDDRDHTFIFGAAFGF